MKIIFFWEDEYKYFLEHVTCLTLYILFPQGIWASTKCNKVERFVRKVYIQNNKRSIHPLLSHYSVCQNTLHGLKSVTVSTFSPSICHNLMEPDPTVLVFWMLIFRPPFSLSIKLVMPSNHLILCHSPSSPTLNLSQHQGLFKWVRSFHQVPKILEFQLQHQSFQWIFRTDFL